MNLLNHFLFNCSINECILSHVTIMLSVSFNAFNVNTLNKNGSMNFNLLTGNVFEFDVIVSITDQLIKKMLVHKWISLKSKTNYNPLSLIDLKEAHKKFHSYLFLLHEHVVPWHVSRPSFTRQMIWLPSICCENNYW